MNILNIRKKSGGQVVLIVLLASAVLLTLGLSVSKKATTDVKIDTDQELLKKAFNSAESGIDYFLGTGKTNYTETKSTVKVDVKSVGVSASIDSGTKISSGNPFLFWLVDHFPNGDIGASYYKGTVNLCADSSFNGALKIDYYYNDGSSYKVLTRVYNTGTNTVIGAIQDGFNSIKCITLTDLLNGNSLLLAVMPIGDQTKLTLNNGGLGQDFPLQGQDITSTGNVGGVNSQVKVSKRYKVPSFMLNSITAGGSVLNQ
ncbi:MAG: hypothetical protein WCG91_02330 [Candidatus Shapirobacteria bacterium]